MEKPLKKKKSDFYQIFLTSSSFNVLLQIFFTPTVKLKKEQIDLFMLFCEDDLKSKSFLKTENKFQRIDFMITKNEEFKRITTFEK